MKSTTKKLMSSNQQIVFDLIIEFHNSINDLIIEEESLKNYYKNVRNYLKEGTYLDYDLGALFYLVLLREIVSKYILVKNFNEETLINQISHDYLRRLYSKEDILLYNMPYEMYKESGYWIGIEDFIDYRKTLIIEKDIFGFKNLAVVYEKEKKRLSNQQCTL